MKGEIIMRRKRYLVILPVLIAGALFLSQTASGVELPGLPA